MRRFGVWSRIWRRWSNSFNTGGRRSSPAIPRFFLPRPGLKFHVVFLFFFVFFVRPAFAYDRIVSLKPNLTEILFALGVGDKIVGVTSFCDWPPDAQKIDRVADYIQPDLEKLISKHPDLIVTSQENSSRREIEFLIRKGYKVLTFPSDTLAQLKKTIVDLGEMVGKKEKAQEIVGGMEREWGELKKRSQGVGGGSQRVLFVVGHQPLMVAGSGNLFEDVADILGLTNVAHDSRFRYPTYSLEMLVSKSPDLILDFTMGSEAKENQQGDMKKWWAQFSKIPAVAQGKVFFLDAGMLRAGPRLPGELKKLFELVHQNP